MRYPVLRGHGKGALIIKSVLESHRLHPADFFGPSRVAHLVAARRDAAQQLIDAGVPPTNAARLLRRNHTTILNYLPELRGTKAARYVGKQVLRHLAPDVRTIVAKFAAAEGVTVYTLMADWIAERATHEADSKARVAA